MANLSKSAFLTKWGGLFADNNTGDISPEDMRDFRQDIADSLFGNASTFNFLTIPIGTWNMDTTASKTVDLTPYSITNDQIIGVLSVQIVGDVTIGIIQSYPLWTGGYFRMDDTDPDNIILFRNASGLFDSIQFSGTSLSRGNIIVMFNP